MTINSTLGPGTLNLAGFSETITDSDVTVSGSEAILTSGAASTINKNLSVGNASILATGDTGVAGTATATNESTFDNGFIFLWDVRASGSSDDKLITRSHQDSAEFPGLLSRERGHWLEDQRRRSLQLPGHRSAPLL